MLDVQQQRQQPTAVGTKRTVSERSPLKPLSRQAGGMLVHMHPSKLTFCRDVPWQ